MGTFVLHMRVEGRETISGRQQSLLLQVNGRWEQLTSGPIVVTSCERNRPQPAFSIEALSVLVALDCERSANWVPPFTHPLTFALRPLLPSRAWYMRFSARSARTPLPPPCHPHLIALHPSRTSPFHRLEYHPALRPSLEAMPRRMFTGPKQVVVIGRRPSVVSVVCRSLPPPFETRPHIGFHTSPIGRPETMEK